MSDNYVGEIRLFPFSFAPSGWAICAGQLIPISQNNVLFSLLGAAYGGNGTSNFALPNLQGQLLVGQGQGPGLSGYYVGETGGASGVALQLSESPLHTHSFNVNTADGSQLMAGNAQLSKAAGGSRTRPVPGSAYTPNATNTTLSPSVLGFVGGGAPHNNMQPYLAMTYCIALQGVFPPRN